MNRLVEDNGRGIPVGIHETESACRPSCINKTSCGGKFDDSTYKASGGLHGYVSLCVNALSESLTLSYIEKEKVHRRQTYAKGVPTSELKVTGNSKKTGTTITFKLDTDILKFQNLTLKP